MDADAVWTILGGVVAIFTVYSGLMIWLITRIENRLEAHMSDNRVEWNAANARIDQTQSIIMRMLEKSSKTG